MQSYRLLLSSPARTILIQQALALNPTFSLARYLDLISRRPAPYSSTTIYLPTQDPRDDDYSPLYERIITPTPLEPKVFRGLLRQARTLFNIEPITDPVTLEVTELPKQYDNRLVSYYLEALGLNLIPSPYTDAQQQPPQTPQTNKQTPASTPASTAKVREKEELFIGARTRCNILLSDQAYNFLLLKAGEGKFIHTQVAVEKIQVTPKESHHRDPIQRMLKNREYRKAAEDKYKVVRIPTSKPASSEARGISDFIIAITPSADITYTDTRPPDLFEAEEQLQIIQFPIWTPTNLLPNNERRYRCLSLPNSTIRAFANLALAHLIFEINESGITERIPISIIYKKRYCSNAIEAIGLQLLTPSKWPAYPYRRYFRELAAKRNYTSEAFQ